MIAADDTRDKNLNMVFTTAIEGGINYWARVIEYEWSTRNPEGHVTGDETSDFYAEIWDREDHNKDYRIDIRTIRMGIRTMYTLVTKGDDEHPRWENQTGYQARAIKDLYAALRAGKNSDKWDDLDYDADTADMIVQAGLFGEVVYG